MNHLIQALKVSWRDFTQALSFLTSADSAGRVAVILLGSPLYLDGWVNLKPKVEVGLIVFS
jgi:hypothetical protein